MQRRSRSGFGPASMRSGKRRDSCPIVTAGISRALVDCEKLKVVQKRMPTSQLFM
jgi:hypothetical protein